MYISMEKGKLQIYTCEECRRSLYLEPNHFQLSRFARGCGVQDASVGDTKPTEEVWSTSLW